MWPHGWLSWLLIWFYTCVCWVYPLWFQFLGFFPLLESHGLVLLMYSIWLFQFHFRPFPCFRVQPLKFYFAQFFFGFPPIGVSLVMNYWLVLKVLHGWLDALLGKIFIFGILLGSYFGVSLVMFPWLAPSEVLFGRVILQISLIGISMLPCVNLLVGRVGWQFLDFWMHELNLVQNEW